MRRLPVFFLIDVSESMAGEPLREVENGLSTVIRELKKDPYALETAFVSISVFAGKAKNLMPLTDIISFYPPRLPLGCGTSLGNALDHLSKELQREVLPTTADRKGDWKPLIFIFTDGIPTDKFEASLENWKRKWGNKVAVVCVAFGSQADTSILQRITENVLVFNNHGPEAYAAFFKWVSASIRVNSQSLNAGSQETNLAPRDPDIVRDLPGASSSTFDGVDNAVATFIARCSANKKPYLIKYKSQGQAAYRLEGTFVLGDDFAELSEPGAERLNAAINSDWLSGYPNCPACGNTMGMCLCPCGNLFCADEKAESTTCPWCNRNLSFSKEGPSNFDIHRSRG